jgi:hypothetical protein
MRYLEVVIRVKEENGEMVTETPLDTHRLEMLDLLSVPRQERIDQLEADTLEKGREIMRTILLKQWELLDRVLASSHQHINQDCQVVFDGKTDLKIASRLGILHLGQQVCYCKSCQAHFLPLTPVLPEHQGMIITRGLQEWACLLPQGLPFASAARLLGWQTQEEQVISDTEVRSLVQEHGQVIRQAELAEVKALEAKEDLCELKPNLVPLETPRRHPAWPAELSAAVEAALETSEPAPPKGVARADWERVLAYQQEARDTALQQEEDEMTLLEEEPLTDPAQPAQPI